LGIIEESTAAVVLVALKLIEAGYNMKKTSGKFREPRAYTLAELLAAMTIGAMVLVAVLGIYNRAENSAAAVTRKLDASRLPSEVLQRIAEDLDSIISAGSDVKITIENKLENLFPAAKLTILRTINDSRDREQKFEEIVWQSSYDFESAIDGLVLYRSHSGIVLEDKVLEKNKDDWERELFVPICGGVTFFKISAVRGGQLIDRWSGSLLPAGIVATISFSEPFKRVDGTFDMPDEEKITRTIAIDRTRKIKFEVVASKYAEEEEEAKDVNVPDVKSLPSAGPDKDEKAK